MCGSFGGETRRLAGYCRGWIRWEKVAETGFSGAVHETVDVVAGDGSRGVWADGVCGGSVAAGAGAERDGADGVSAAADGEADAAAGV